MRTKAKKILVLTNRYLNVIISKLTTLGVFFMTFSEYIKLYAIHSYKQFCIQNYIKPNIDIDIQEPKLCALVKPALDSANKK